MPDASPYDADFREEAIKLFLERYREQSEMRSPSAISSIVARELGIARSTLESWARKEGKFPAPTWGEILELRQVNTGLVRQAERAKDHARQLEDQVDELRRENEALKAQINRG